jgi:transcriptional regulator with XRE-family HTH domain
MDVGDLRAALGLYLARRRLALKLSQQQVAITAGCAHSTISRIEMGRYFAPYGLLLRLCVALGITQQQLHVLLEDLHYRERVLACLFEFGERNRSTASLLVTMLGGVTLDAQANQELVRPVLAIRRSLLVRAPLPTLDPPLLP